jgi:hypothetical protein
VAISGHQWPSAVISGHQWPSAVISGHQWPSAVISGHQRSSAVISGHQSYLRIRRGRDVQRLVLDAQVVASDCILDKGLTHNDVFEVVGTGAFVLGGN